MRSKPLIFLDIDGVLNTGRGAFLPQNSRLAEERQEGASQLEILSRIAFDPVSVALLNYLLERVEPQLVVHSDWAVHFDERLPEILAAQGVRTEHMYARYLAVAAPSLARDARILGGWFDGADSDDGPPYAILDDSRFSDRQTINHHVHVDRHVGLAKGDVRVALALLGVDEDLDAGFYSVDDQDWHRVWEAYDNGDAGDYVRALRWLHDDRFGYAQTRAEQLAREPYDDPVSALLGTRGMSREKRKEMVFKELPGGKTDDR